MDKGSNISFPLDSGSTVYNGSGISVGGKASTDILHAAGGTTKIKTLNGESMLGEGNIVIDPSSVPVSLSWYKKYMRHSMNDGEHFTESEAMDLVSDMYHTEGGRKYSGEKFDIHKAKEICERYRGVIPVSATPTDVYVAINSQYHDYVELFKSWFGDNVDQKIIESAIIFWFKDVDCKAENKVVEYLGEY